MLLTSVSKMVLNCSFPVAIRLYDEYFDILFISSLEPHIRRYRTPRKAVRMCLK